jgi:two-component system, OmpR family, response regulator
MNRHVPAGRERSGCLATLVAMLTVGLCEDDVALRSTLVRALRSVGHDVVVAHDGREALSAFPNADPDVVVLDIGLPDSDGRDVCLALRAGGLSTPVLFLTAHDGVHDKVAGFESGADDYLTKPFELPELLARLAALARRAHRSEGPAKGLVLDPAQHAVTDGTSSVPLTPTEFRLLAKLLGAPDEVVRRHQLVAAGWPMGAVVNDNTLDTYIRRLRSKLATIDHGAHAIETVRGVGYVWR